MNKFEDERGNFIDLNRFKTAQTNIAYSKCKGVLRGMHAQWKQVKLITVLEGEIHDIFVNPETGEIKEYHLKELESVLIPANWFHGYLCYKPTKILYQVNIEYNPDDEYGCHWSSVKWPFQPTVISDKDREWEKLDFNKKIC